MSIFNNIKFELLILALVTISVFITFDTDLWFYTYFESLDDNANGIFLKEFFVDITRLGKSSLYFVISIVGFALFYFGDKFKIIRSKTKNKLANFFISSFLYILIVGIITQFIKHIVGRPRPNHINFEDVYNFNFFTLESNFHSFPSGHSSTIFIVCFLLVAVFPKLKYFFYFLASIIALSRVVVGAHFFTDIVAGAILALLSFKVLNYLIEAKYHSYKLTNLASEKNIEVFYYLLFLFVSCAFITVGPSLDLYISGIFYYGSSQFAIQSFDPVSILFRDILLPLILIYILILPIVGRFTKIEKFFFNYKFSTKEIFLLWASQIFTVLIFVNFILKNLWGRARPNDVLQLGGEEIFSPWYIISSACETNCSFVSGDASVGFSVVILYLITKKIIFLYASIVAGFMIGLVRIMAGGHFLSDIFFAGIFVVTLNIVFFKLYKKLYDK